MPFCACYSSRNRHFSFSTLLEPKLLQSPSCIMKLSTCPSYGFIVVFITKSMWAVIFRYHACPWCRVLFWHWTIVWQNCLNLRHIIYDNELFNEIVKSSKRWLHYIPHNLLDASCKCIEWITLLSQLSIVTFLSWTVHVKLRRKVKEREKMKQEQFKMYRWFLRTASNLRTLPQHGIVKGTLLLLLHK